MKPTPWSNESVEQGEHAAAAALAAARAEPAPWSSQREREVLESIRARTHAPAWFLPRPVILAAASMVLLTTVAAMARRASIRAEAAAPSVQATADADYQLAPAKPGHPASLKVTRGSVRVSSRSTTRYELDVPGLRGHIDAQQFRVQVAAAYWELDVESGTAEVLAFDGQVVRVTSGHSIQSTDPRFHPAPPVPAPVPAGTGAPTSSADPCPALTSTSARRSCYLRVAQGNDLAAQNAILELGMLEQDEAHDGAAALESWRGYQKRFPEGPLAPEASVAILGELLAEHRLTDAQSEADRFIAKYPHDGRVGEVLLNRAELECQAQGANALAGFRALEATPGIEPSELFFRRGNCEAQLGQRDAARLHWRQALEGAPPARASQLRRLLGD